jgi:hypothetical protein
MNAFGARTSFTSYHLCLLMSGGQPLSYCITICCFRFPLCTYYRLTNLRSYSLLCIPSLPSAAFPPFLARYAAPNSVLTLTLHCTSLTAAGSSSNGNCTRPTFRLFAFVRVPERDRLEQLAWRAGLPVCVSFLMHCTGPARLHALLTALSAFLSCLSLGDQLFFHFFSYSSARWRQKTEKRNESEVTAKQKGRRRRRSKAAKVAEAAEGGGGGRKTGGTE